MKRKSVIVFTTPTCTWCRRLKQYLKLNNIRYKEIDVSRDSAAMNDMVRKSGQRGVPQTWIDNRPIVGFDERRLKKLLDI